MSANFFRTAFVAALVATSASANDRLENEAKRIFNLADVTVQDLNLPAQPATDATFQVTLEGLPFTVDVRQHSVRSNKYEVLHNINGVMRPAAPAPIRTVRGEILEDPGSIIAGAIHDDGFYAKIVLSSGDMYWIEPLVSKTDMAAYGEHAVYHQQDVLSTPGLCGTDSLSRQNVGGSQFVDGTKTTTAGAVLKVCEVAAEADTNFYNSYGSTAATENRMELVINTMNVQYENEVDITHEIITTVIHVGSDPYSTTDAGDLLGQVRSYWIGNMGGTQRDIVHMFTGRNLNGGTIGVAYLGGICSNNIGYGLVQSNCCGSLSCATDLSAHELGHNWNAGHCSCSSFTMNSSLTCSNQFHNTSTEPVIEQFRDSRQCLHDQNNGNVLFSDNFESGNWGSWSISSSARCKIKQHSAFTGTWGAKLKKGGVGTGACTVGTSETWAISPSFSTLGFSFVELNMDSHFRQQEIGCEFMDCQVSVNGGAWQSFGTIETHAWNNYTMSLPLSAGNQGDVRLRFITNAKGQNERAEIDNLVISGL